jgi:acyl-CoA dehydrogenase
MHFAYSDKMERLQGDLRTFLDERVLPAEEAYFRQRELGETPWVDPPIIEELKTEARARGLWNLFLPTNAGVPG